MDTGQLKPELRRRRGKIAATIVVAHTIKHIYISGKSTLIIPEIKIGLGLSRSQFGSLTTSNAAAWWLSTMAAGYLGDRFSNRVGLMLGISLGLMGVSYALAGWVPSYRVLLGVTFLMGIGPSMFHPPAIAELSRRFPDRRGFAVSLHGMAASAGGVLGAPTVAAFLMFMVWRDLMKASLFPALGAAIAVWLLLPSSKAKEEAEVTSFRTYFVSLTSLLHNRVLLILALTTALRSIGEGGVGQFVPLYLRDDLHYSLTTVAVIMSVSQIGGIVAQPAMGYLSDRFGRKSVLLPATALVMLSAFALSAARPGAQLFLVIFVRGAFAMSLNHITVAAALDAARGAAQSTVVSLIYGAGFLGTFSPYIAGLISDRYGIHSAFVFGGIVLIAPTLLLALTKLQPPDAVFEPEVGGGHGPAVHRDQGAADVRASGETRKDRP